MYSDVTSVGCNYDLVDYWFTANEERGEGGSLYFIRYSNLYITECVSQYCIVYNILIKSRYVLDLKFRNSFMAFSNIFFSQ